MKGNSEKLSKRLYVFISVRKRIQFHRAAINIENRNKNTTQNKKFFFCLQSLEKQHIDNEEYILS